MITLILILSCAYAVIAGLLLHLNLRSHHARGVKLGAIILVTGFYFISFYHIGDLRGHAVPDTPPNPFKLHWAIIEEPDKATRSKGQIYILAQALNKYGSTINHPRLYALPFSPELAQAIENARQAIEDGTPIQANLNIYKAKTPTREPPPDPPQQQEGVTALPDPQGENLQLNFKPIVAPALPPKRN